MSPRTAIAGTVGIDSADLIQYQPGRFRPAVYSIDNGFACASKREPKFHGTALEGRKWEKHFDQFWAEQADTVVWVSK